MLIIDLSDVSQELDRFGLILSSVNVNDIKERLEESGNVAYKELLSEWEYLYISNLKFLKRKSEFISGRIAGKEAFISFLKKSKSIGFDYKKLNFNDIEIRRFDTGEPAVFIDEKKVDIHISITHSGKFALSLIGDCREFKGIGIDLERIEARDEAFLNIAFNKNEISILGSQNLTGLKWDDEKVTRFWTIKESVLKTFGSGLNINLKNIEIVESETGELKVKFTDKAEKKFFEFGGIHPQVKSYKINGYIVSTSWIN